MKVISINNCDLFQVHIR